MCVPLLTAIGTAVSTVGSIQQGRAAAAAATAQANAADQNAKISAKQAELAAQNGAREEREMRQRGAAFAASQKAGFSASGLDIGAGSPLSVLMDTNYQNELDALTVRRNASNKVWGYQAEQTNFTNQANAARSAARNARSTANLMAVGSLLTGATTLSSQYSKAKAAGVKNFWSWGG